MTTMGSYFGGNSIKRYLLYPFYIGIERRLKKMGIDADFRFYLSFFNFKNLSSKSVLDVGTDPASPIYFIKNKVNEIVVSRDQNIAQNMTAFFNGQIIPPEEIGNVHGDVLKFDYSADTRRFFNNIDLSKYSEWVIIFNKDKTDDYDYEVRTRLMRELGGTIIGSKDNNIIVWGKINKF